jgi:long-chain acyl-CoA synthetase
MAQLAFTKVKKIHLHDEMFTLENGLATPTMKIVRHEVRRRFADTIDALYK